MATDRNLSDGSEWCRACGGRATVFEVVSTCHNLASGAQQKSPRDHCRTPPAGTRLLRVVRRAGLRCRTVPELRPVAVVEVSQTPNPYKSSCGFAAPEADETGGELG